MRAGCKLISLSLAVLVTACWADFPRSRFHPRDGRPPDSPAHDGPTPDGGLDRALPDVGHDGPTLDHPLTDLPRLDLFAADQTPDQKIGDLAPDLPPPDLPSTADLGCVDLDKDGVTTCGGDCNDGDPTVKPSQTAFFTTPSNGSFDYNCDKAIDPEHPDLVNCVVQGSGCIGSGWKGAVPPCGALGMFSECKRTGNTCVKDTNPIKQGCR